MRGKVPIEAQARCCFVPGLDETSHLYIDQMVDDVLVLARTK